MQLPLLFGLVILAYLLGSLCSAIIVCKLFKLPDPRTQGSSNPGATNVLRIGGKYPAVCTLIGDMLKAVLPIVIANTMGMSDLYTAIILLSAVLGHIFPVFFGFKGGKAVATTVGGLMFFNLQLGLAFVVTWLLTAKLTKISSLGALVAAVSMPIFKIILSGVDISILPLCLLSIIILWTHRSNIKRLLSGTEPVVGKK